MTDQRNIIDFPDIPKVEAEAAEWIMIFEDGDETADDIVAFRAWLAQGDPYREAYHRLAALWGALDRLDDLEEIPMSTKNTPSIRTALSETLLSRRSGLVGIAASVAAAVCVGVVLQTNTENDYKFNSTYATKLGERQTVTLPDGSEVILNTNSEIEVEFNVNERLVFLKRGEAFFDVESDPTKPFSVFASGAAVKAVGTAFTVRLREEKVDVTVSEGRVALYAATKESVDRPFASKPIEASFLQITAGQKAVFREKIETLEHVQPSAMKRKLSWREGMLAFSGDPLFEMVDEVSRYTDVQIDIEGEELRLLPVAGYFAAGEVESMLEALTLMADIEVEYVNAKRITLRAKEGH